MSIMKYRFDGRLIFNKTIDSQLMQIKIPRLILQPIVENSINHGIGQTTNLGEITINANFVDEDIVIEICDNGKGMQSEKLDALCHKINLETPENEGGSIGLSNVNKRIKLFYGEAYGINIESKMDVYTKVIVRIPKNNKNNERYYV